jgi:hypothetical protein
MGRGDRKKKVSVSSVDSNSDKLDEILHRLESLDTITAKLASMEAKLAATQEENKMLNVTVQAQDKKILELQDRLNSLEQHGRSYSVRVSSLELGNVNERDPPAIIKKVYDAVFLPIFQGAASKGTISQVPSCYEAIEMAHPLPARGDKPKPIIVRFFKPQYKSPAVPTPEGIRNQDQR